MKKYDVVIIGSSPQSQSVAAELTKEGRKTALITLPGAPETLQARVLFALDPTCVTPPEGPALTNIDLYSNACHFLDERTLQVGEEKFSFKDVVIASGCQLNIPQIQGLDQVSYETPLSILSKDSVSSSALVLGAGPLGVALAAHLAHKKCAVSLISRSPVILPNEDEGLSRTIHKKLSDIGVRIWTGATATQVKTGANNKITVVINQNETRHEGDWDALVVSTGLFGNTGNLDLDKGGVFVAGDGIIVTNEESRCSRKGVWAMGSATGTEQSFSLEAYQAEQIVHNIKAPFYDKKKQEPNEPFLFFVPGKVPYSRVGITENQAKLKYKNVCTVEVGNYLKLIAKKNGEILGVHAMGEQAAAIGLFFEWALRAQILVSDLNESRYFPPVSPSSHIHKAVRLWMSQHAD